VGGGKGHATEKIREITKSIPGRVILQDLPAVIEDIDEPLPGVERVKYDFFTPQPINGAYYSASAFHFFSYCVVSTREVTCHFSS